MTSPIPENNLVTNEIRQRSFPAIPAWLVQAGLTGAEFRVYCEVASSAWVRKPIGDLAAACHYEPKTIRKALKTLVARGMLYKIELSGRPTLYAALVPIEALQKPTPRPSPVTHAEN